MLITAINYLFSTTELNKLYCQTGAFNIASVQLLEKLNFHRDGILREHHELDCKMWDDYIYSILRSEWKTSTLFSSNIIFDDRSYFDQICPQLIDEHYNWFITIEPNSGDYFIDQDIEVAEQKAYS